MFESNSRHSLVVKTRGDSSTAKPSDIGANVTGSRIWPLLTNSLCDSRCGTLKNSHCLVVIAAEQRPNLQPFTGYGDFSIWVKKFLSGTKTPKQTNKQTNKQTKNMHISRAKPLVITWLVHHYSHERQSRKLKVLETWLKRLSLLDGKIHQ